MVRIPLLPAAPAAEVEAVGIAAEVVVDIAAEGEAVVGIAMEVVAAGPTGANQQ
jgi:hypothetical protein